MAKKKSRSKQQKREQTRKQAPWETEPIGASWVPFAMALAIGLPALGLAAWNRGQLATIKETTQPVPDSEKNIKELWDSIRSVQTDQRQQKALIDANKARLQSLETTLDQFPNRDELEKAGKQLEALTKEGGQIQTKIRADMDAISATRRKLEEKLDSPWYAIAAPLGSAFLWGGATFIVTYPVFGSLLFTQKPTDEALVKKQNRNRLALSGSVAGVAALVAWLATGGPEGLGIGG